jgi:hypothetical protein
MNSAQLLMQWVKETPGRTVAFSDDDDGRRAYRMSWHSGGVITSTRFIGPADQVPYERQLLDTVGCVIRSIEKMHAAALMAVHRL